MVMSAISKVVRIPKRSIAAAAKGPVNPKRKMPVAAAKLIVLRDQPKAVSHGTIRTPGVDLRPAAANRAQKMIAVTASA